MNALSTLSCPPFREYSVVLKKELCACISIEDETDFLTGCRALAQEEECV
jgi:hypothetical protein